MHGFYVSCMYLICFLELDKNGMGECEDLWWSDDQSLLTSHPGTIKTTIINGAWLRWWPNLWALGAPPHISVFSSADICICILYTECKVYFELPIWGQAKWTLGHIFIHHSKPPVAVFFGSCGVHYWSLWIFTIELIQYNQSQTARVTVTV